MRRRFGTTLVALDIALTLTAVAAVPRDARADTPDVAYESPPECPSQTEFLQLVKERAQQSLAADSLTRQRRYTVVIRSDHGTYEGQLTAHEPDRPPLLRSVSGPSCKDVADALAFIAALSGDASGDTAPPVAPPAAISPESPAPAAPAPIEPSTARWSGMAGMLSDISALMAAPVVGFSAFFDLALARPGMLSPSARVGFDQTLVATTSVAEGSAHFRWTRGQLELCPIVGSLAASLSVRPCGRIEAGIVHAAGDLVGTARSASTAWAGLSALARLEWVVVPPISLELQAGALVPLTRKTFYFQPTSEIYEPPPVAGFGGVGAGVRIW
jgi:hypothetical protein